MSSLPIRFALDRIAVEQDRLTGAAALMDRIVPDVSPFGVQTKTRLDASLNSVRIDWDQLRKIVDDDDRLTSRLETLSQLGEATDRVVGEITALASGVLAREKNLDGGACAQADRLIAELASDIDPRLARVTIPGTTEFLHRGSDLIRRRLPDHGLWDLPIMAHEFGHLVVSHRSWKPKEDQLLELRPRVVTGWPDCSDGLGEEHFCDVYATYAAGPAFAATLLLHRLRPHASATNGETHPADPRRAAVVLTTLEKLSASEPRYSRYSRLCAQLAEVWHAVQQSAPDTARLEPDTRNALEVRAKDVLQILDAELEAARYKWPSGTVRDLADALEHDRNPDAELTYQIRDVLAAAWMLRAGAISSGSGIPESLCTRATLLIDAGPQARQPSGQALR